MTSQEHEERERSGRRLRQVAARVRGSRRRIGRRAGVLVVAAIAASVLPQGPVSAADASTGTFQLRPGSSATSSWLPRPAAAGGTTLDFTVPRRTSRDTLYLAVELPASGGTSYRGRVKVLWDGTMTVSTSKVTAGGEVVVKNGPTLAPKAVAGKAVHLEVVPTSKGNAGVAVRAWPDGSALPSWQLRWNDAVPASAFTGQSRAWGYLSGSARTTVPVGYRGSVAALEVKAPTAPVPPGPTTTGVPAGTTLTPYYGDLVIKTPGAHYDALDIHGFVEVKAPDVTITRSLVRGGVRTGNRGLVTNTTPTATNFVIEDSTLVPDVPSVWYDGLKGSNFTARRVNISGTVDNVKVHGDNVRVEGSWLHDSAWFAVDPNQGGTPTHNDGVQVLGGKNIAIVGNSISGASNAALQVTQDYSATTGLAFDGNWADGGTCTVKLAHKGLAAMSGISVRDNKFGRATSILNCPVLATGATSLVATGNTWLDSGAAVSVRRYG